MLLYIALDLNMEAWGSEQEEPFTALRIFMNAFLRSHPENRIKIINSLKIIHDSSSDNDLETVIELSKSGRKLSVTPADVGLALYGSAERILIFSMTSENKDHFLNYAKCMSLAAENKVRIDVFSKLTNNSLELLAEGTGGSCFSTFSIENFLSLLGSFPSEYPIKDVLCYCCSKRTDVGHVCPVCLTVYCKFVPICKRCKIKFIFAK
ncbi:transcription initiation factor TFIIH subunit 3 [Enteropsectra breve]|nr:transcription initiation factor TFIIH subunit 3 [Enteropsectra breve]